MPYSLTNHRKKILELIKSREMPLSAKEIHKIVKRQINLSTIYRALQYLENNKLIEGFTIPCKNEGTVRYYYKKETPHKHFFHCEKCHCFIHFTHCDLNTKISNFQKSSKNEVYEHILYFLGICNICKNT